MAGRLELEAQLVPSRGYWAVGDDFVLGSSDVVVDVVNPAVLDVYRVAARGGALAQQDALRAGLRDFDVGGDAVGAVEDPWRSEEWDRLMPG